MNLYAFADEASTWIDRQIEAMERNHLKGVELRGVDEVNVSDISIEKAAEVRKKLDGHGLITWSIGSPIGKIKLENDFGAELDRLKHTVEVANILGTDKIRMFSIRLPKGEDPSIYRNEVIDRVGAYLDVVEGSGVCLYHENEKGIYGDSAERCRDLFDVFPKLRGIFDPANFVQCGVDTLKAWAMLKDRISYMHIKDALPNGFVVPAGEGDGHVAEIVGEFIAKGGADFTIEPHLYTFDALKTIEEKGGETLLGQVRAFETADEAFDFACSAFRKLAEDQAWK
ncbi:MAG: sugar phosphate isomerase/epimerase [Lachnospiraceae bacterium]|nr:sugar phosphate isomerase/epimerase [Lachnospiraceae bacterium]